MTVFHEYVRNLSVTHVVQDSAVMVTVAGEVDIGTVCLLEKGLIAATALRPQVLVADLRQVRFFGAAGVTALVKADISCRQQGVALRILAGHRAVLRPLEIAGQIEALQASPEPSLQWTRRRNASRTVLDAAGRILVAHWHDSAAKSSSARVE